MEKKYNYILDKVLEYLLKKKSISGNFEKLKGEFNPMELLKEFMTNELKLDYWQLDLILRHLSKEKFTVNELDPDDNITGIKLTLDGVIFIQNGGYCQLQEDLRIKRVIDRIEIMAVILGGVFASLYYFRELFCK